MPRRLFLSGAVVALTALPALGVAPVLAADAPAAASVARSTAVTAAADDPPIRLWAPTGITAYTEGNRTYVDLGVRLSATTVPFEIWSHRASYRDPIVSTWRSPAGDVTLPEGSMQTFRGLHRFLQVTVRDRDGEIVRRQRRDTCLSGQGERARPDAPARSPYPEWCPYNPYTRGSVNGIQAGWNLRLDTGYSQPVGPGRYTVTVRITAAYKRAFGLPESAVTRTIALTVKEGSIDYKRRTNRTDGAVAQPNASEPQGDSGGRLAGPAPDLRALPAFGMSIGRKSEILRFGANVWNAGDSPLVIDGFRREGEDVMDAYQYFFNADGDQTGYQRVGTMIFHNAPSHMHWHLLDFARYSLLNADRTEVLRSRKQSFCLANTDPVDFTVAGANWHPENTDLHTACGGQDAYSIREVLDSGSGDTYFQERAGQAFNLTGLPNGRYFVKVEANPRQRLVEHKLANNVSLRPIWIGGKPGARTVHMAPVGIVEENFGGYYE